VTDAPIAVPALKRDQGSKQAFMDVHVVSRQGTHYIIEIQSQRHTMVDESVLFYACGTFAHQLTESELRNSKWYTNLKAVIALNIFDHDSNHARLKGFSNMVERVREHPLKDKEFIKHYKLTDKISGQEINHLQLVQVVLPQAEINNPLFPPSKDFSLQDWWVSILRHAKWYDSETVEEWYKNGSMPEVIYMALKRLYLPDWNPLDVKCYKLELVDVEVFALTLEVSKAEGIKEGKKETSKEIARVCKASGESKEKIAQWTGLSIDEIDLLR